MKDSEDSEKTSWEGLIEMFPKTNRKSTNCTLPVTSALWYDLIFVPFFCVGTGVYDTDEPDMFLGDLVKYNDLDQFLACNKWATEAISYRGLFRKGEAVACYLLTAIPFLPVWSVCVTVYLCCR